ncbi:MAG: response regulator [Candidatus Poribacteria bacterium]|nr:response regulator [Candidatus Poribacteria bacterium]
MRTVLIVDDNDSVRAALERALRQAGYVPMCAQDASEAAAAYRKYRIDACLIDYDLPDINGAQLMASLQRMRPGVPMSLITGNPSEDAIYEACRAGASAYFKKPLDLDRLKRWLTKASAPRSSVRRLRFILRWRWKRRIVRKK